MAEIVKTYVIPDENVPELIATFGQNYQAQIEDPENPGEMIPNPQSKAAFASAIFDEEIHQYVRRRVVNYRKQQTLVNLDQDFPVNAQ